MLYRENVMYDMVCLPAREKKFEEFSKKEAEIYLKWYISEIDNRILVLKNMLKMMNVNANLIIFLNH